MHIVCIFALIHIYARACTKLLMIQAYERVKRAFCIYILIASSYVGRSLFFPPTSTLLFERNLIMKVNCDGGDDDDDCDYDKVGDN